MNEMDEAASFLRALMNLCQDRGAVIDQAHVVLGGRDLYDVFVCDDRATCEPDGREPIEVRR